MFHRHASTFPQQCIFARVPQVIRSEADTSDGMANQLPTGEKAGSVRKSGTEALQKMKDPPFQTEKAECAPKSGT